MILPSSLLGFLCGVSGFIRGASYLPILALFLVLWFRENSNVATKYFCFCTFFTLALVLTAYPIENRNEFLRSQGLEKEITTQRHPLWHNAYIGLGYINNSLGIREEDGCGEDYVRSVKPWIDANSAEYESILKSRTLSIIFHNPVYFLIQLSAKLGVILFYFFFFGFPNIYLFWKYGFPEWGWYFVPSALAGALPGLIMSPEVYYLLGFNAVVITFTFMNLCRMRRSPCPDGEILSRMKCASYEKGEERVATYELVIRPYLRGET